MSTDDRRWDPVLIGSGEPGAVSRQLGEAAPTGVDAALRLAPELDAPRPGQGRTVELWEGLATAAAVDLEVARALEPHVDAMAILDEADLAEVDRDRVAALGRTWGVYAAEGGPARLTATQVDDGWRLDGVKPWCSLAGSVDAALVTAWVDDDRRGLFAVGLRRPGVEVAADDWHARGLVAIPSGAVAFDGVPALPVGEAGWYLQRPGFAWGGIGVAACWFGGVVGIARTLHTALRAREPGPLRLAHLGAVDEVLEAARLALADAAARVDAGTTDPLLPKRVRGIVARAAEEAIVRVGHALGPAPLVGDAAHAQRIADLTLYVRQHHAEADQASLGERLVRHERPW